MLGGEEGNTGGAVDDNPPVPDGALNGLEGYSFAYDALSRLTAADYRRNDSRSTDYDTRYTYDSMGNILTLKRRGMMEKPDTAAHTPATYADIDDLTFDYDGNQIVKITDAVDDGPYYQGAWHYRDNADAQQERFYDGNGNLTKDLDAKISDIQYNSLNLPIMITFTDGSTTRYTYDAAGRKLRTEHRVMTTGVFNPGLDDGGEAVPDTGGIALPFPDDPGLAVGEGGLGAWPEMSVFEELEQLLGEELAEGEEGIEEGGGEPTLPATELPVPVGTGTSSLPYELTVTDYCGNFIYENGKLSRILFDGGFITFPDSVIPHPEIAGATCIIADITRPQYHYYFTDHLGSVRVVTDAQGNIEQTNNYYPYGGLMASSSTISNPVSQANVAANQPNRYNGKELDRKNNLDWMDYGARHFAGHGQWTSPDPLAEKYYDWSPYVYCIGNPIKFVDPDGRKVKPASVLELTMIQNTLPKDARNYVQLDENGFIDQTLLKSYNGKSANYDNLIELVNSDITLDVILNDQYTYKGKDGSLGTNTMGYNAFDPKYDTESDKDVTGETLSGISSGESGFLGKTLFPGSDAPQNSPTQNIIVVVNKNLSVNGAAEVYSHEANGHALLYIRNGRDVKGASHQPKNGLFEGGETNVELREMIIRSKKETIVNMQ